MDKGAWRAAQSRTRLKRRSTHTHTWEGKEREGYKVEGREGERRAGRMIEYILYESIFQGEIDS